MAKHSILSSRGQSRGACLLYLHATLGLRVLAKGAPDFAEVSDPAGRGTPTSIAPLFCSSQKINIRSIMIPDMYYRDDIDERWFEDHDRLHTWGYLREI
jgi:hypothetical protein